MIGSEPELSKGNVPVMVEFKLLTSFVGDTTEEMIKLIIVSRGKCLKILAVCHERLFDVLLRK